MIPYRRPFILLACLLLSGLAACSPTPTPRYYQTWTYADLRAMGPAGLPNPELDLVALYTRRIGSEVQVRLDALDLPASNNYDLYLALDTGPGGARSLPIDAAAGFDWDFLVELPASGDIRVFAPDPSSPTGLQARPGMGVRIVRDPVLDMLTVSLNAAGLDTRTGFRAAFLGAFNLGGSNFGVQAFITPAGSPLVASSLGPARSDGVPPPPARTLFAFWDSLSAYTPAQALRRWDGAHTGPLGGRHGLGNLLRAAHDTGTPLVLLDLASPANLAALDYVGGLGLVKELADSGLLVLPQALPGSPGSPGLASLLPGWAWPQAAAASRQAALDFGLPASPFLFASSGLLPGRAGTVQGPTGSPFGDLPTPAPVVFLPRPADPSGPAAFPVARWQDRRIVFIPQPGAAPAPEQVSPDGPSIEVRRALVQAALQAAQDPGETPGEAPLLVLGGDLPASTWGDPHSARAAFQYLAVHPWVQELAAPDLLALRPSGPVSISPTLQPSLSSEPALLPVSGLSRLPANALEAAAWQAALALLDPVYPASPGLPALRGRYSGQVGALLAGARWAANPTSQASCSADPDQDGQAECVLATQNFYAIFEPQSGALAWAFARDPQGVHQVVGVSSQLASGLSEPSTWNLEGGLSADPQVLAGAFADTVGNSPVGGPYQASLSGDALTFTSPGGLLRKTFRLTAAGLRLEYHTTTSLTVRIPLTVDPWVRFSPGWSRRYGASREGSGWLWELRPLDPQGQPSLPADNLNLFTQPAAQDRLKVELRGPAGMNFYAFTESLAFISVPEDPNREYSPGHYLPFPTGMAEATAQGDFTFEIGLR